MNNKTLLYIFIALLAIYGISQLGGGKKERSFNTELVKLDTSEITRIVVYPRADEFQEVTLTRAEGNWIVTKGTITTKALSNKVNSVLKQLTLIKTNRIAAKSPEKWKDYEVNENEGTRMQVYAGSDLLKDFIIGRVAFKQNQNPQNPYGGQQAPDISYFVRLTDEDEVFAVKGDFNDFISGALTQDFNAYRDRKITNLNPADVTGLSYKISDYVFDLNKTGNDWMVNNDQIMDSTAVANLVFGFSKLDGSSFADDFDPVQKAGTLENSLTIQANNQLEPIIIHCYADTTRQNPFVIHSTLNKEAYFESDSTGVFAKLFTAANDLFVPSSDE